MTTLPVHPGADAVLDALDPEQREVAAHPSGPMCVLAGAGTGKTRAITHRIAYGVAGGGITGWLSEIVAAPTMSRHVRRSLHQLKRQVEHERLRAEAERRRKARERVTAV